MKRILKLLLSIFLPIATIAAALYFYFRLENSSPHIMLLVEYLPFGILLVGMLLAVRFNRSRVFFVLLVLTISLFSLLHIPSFLKLNLPYEALLYALLAIILPINLLVFSILKERGFLTLWGILKIAFIGGQFAGIGWLLMQPEEPGYIFLYKEHIKLPFKSAAPQLALLIMFLAFGILLLKAYFKRTYSDSTFIFTLVATTIALYLGDSKGLLLLFSASSIILIFAIVQDSYRMSYIDELTSLPGRRALKEDMLKLSGGYTIAMLDIDFFKKFNDKHGHDVGDEVLKMVASCLGQVTGGGKAFRYGGEEFTILFPGKELEDAIPHLESLRETVAKRAFIVRGKNRPKSKPKSVKKSNAVEKKLFVTISIGVAKKDKTNKNPNEVMKNADKALYRAKKKGRNCVSK